MRALHSRGHSSPIRSEYLAERKTGKGTRPQRGSYRASVLAISEADDHLDSWKEIASHLKRTVRTVQRWEKQEGLPIHRHVHQSANSVYAYRSELDRWWNREPRFNTVAPAHLPAEDAPGEVMESRPEGECRRTGPTTPAFLIEYAFEPQVAGTCSPGARTGHLVLVLRLQIRIPGFVHGPAAVSTTKGIKAPCRPLPLAASEWSPYSVDSDDEPGSKYVT